LGGIASVDLKADEPGLNALGQELGLPLTFYHRETLQQADGIQNPSTMVHNHIGVPSVCEAAAILASKGGTLIVPKQKNPNVTVAIARRPFTSSASGRAARSTSP
jgi:cobalt-precorrin 5A hydrolase